MSKTSATSEAAFQLKEGLRRLWADHVSGRATTSSPRSLIRRTPTPSRRGCSRTRRTSATRSCPSTARRPVMH